MSIPRPIHATRSSISHVHRALPLTALPPSLLTPPCPQATVANPAGHFRMLYPADPAAATPHCSGITGHRLPAVAATAPSQPMAGRSQWASIRLLATRVSPIAQRRQKAREGEGEELREGEGEELRGGGGGGERERGERREKRERPPPSLGACNRGYSYLDPQMPCAMHAPSAHVNDRPRHGRHRWPGGPSPGRQPRGRGLPRVRRDSRRGLHHGHAVQGL